MQFSRAAAGWLAACPYGRPNLSRQCGNVRPAGFAPWPRDFPRLLATIILGAVMRSCSGASWPFRTARGDLGSGTEAENIGSLPPPRRPSRQSTQESWVDKYLYKNMHESVIPTCVIWISERAATMRVARYPPTRHLSSRRQRTQSFASSQKYQANSKLHSAQTCSKN